MYFKVFPCVSETVSIRTYDSRFCSKLLYHWTTQSRWPGDYVLQYFFTALTPYSVPRAHVFTRAPSNTSARKKQLSLYVYSIDLTKAYHSVERALARFGAKNVSDHPSVFTVARGEALGSKIACVWDDVSWKTGPSRLRASASPVLRLLLGAVIHET